MNGSKCQPNNYIGDLTVGPTSTQRGPAAESVTQEMTPLKKNCGFQRADARAFLQILPYHRPRFVIECMYSFAFSIKQNFQISSSLFIPSLRKSAATCLQIYSGSIPEEPLGSLK